jgi:LysM domain
LDEPTTYEQGMALKSFVIVDKFSIVLKIRFMLFWITSASRSLGRQFLLAACVAFLGLALTACGAKTSMAPGSDDQTATLHTDTDTSQATTPTALTGEDESADKTDQSAAPAEDSQAKERASHVPSGSTRSGPGKLAQVAVRPGDTLWKVSERPDVYGSGWLYPLIYKANKAIIKDPNNLPAGLMLTVPRDVPDPEVDKAKEEAMTGQFLEKVAAAGALANAAVATVVAPSSPPPPPATAPSSPFSTGRLGWILLLLLLAAVAVVAWMRMRKDPDAV